jgi:aspartyl-tRNA synthetase
VQVSGEVVERKDKNKELDTGDIEIFVKKVEDIKILNECSAVAVLILMMRKWTKTRD